MSPDAEIVWCGARSGRCSEGDHARHRRKLSGPLLDRIDLLAYMQRPDPEALESPARTSSADVAAAVAEARERQAARLAGTGLHTNSQLTPRLVRQHVRPTRAATDVLRVAYARGTLSARGRERTLRVARTIADLGGRAGVDDVDIRVALGFRGEEGAGEAAAREADAGENVVRAAQAREQAAREEAA